LKPVSVSRHSTPRSRAIRESRLDDTTVVTTSFRRLPVAACSIASSASSTPTSLPESMR